MARNKTYSLNKNKYLSDSEKKHLTDLLDRFATTNKNVRDCLLIYLGLDIGARASELLILNWADFNEPESMIFITGIKGSNDREIPLSKKTHRLLSRWRKLQQNTQSNQGLIFPVSYPRLDQIWKEYRPVEKKFHSLRHTFAIDLYKRSRDLRLVQVALGHRNINNTMIYADYVYSTEELKKYFGRR